MQPYVQSCYHKRKILVLSSVFTTLKQVVGVGTIAVVVVVFVVVSVVR